MTFSEGFWKYCGVQGILAVILVTGYVAAPYAGVTLPEGFTEITIFVCGFFTAKNGVPAAKAAAARVRPNR